MKAADLAIQNTKRNGYTLTEICIVTLTVGILTSLALTGQTKLATRARLSEAKALINAGLKNGLLLYKQNLLDASTTCQDIGLSSEYTPRWTYDCSINQTILSISASSSGSDGMLSNSITTGTWSLNLENGVVIAGIPSEN